MRTLYATSTTEWLHPMEPAPKTPPEGLIWERLERSTRGPQPGLSHRLITEAAMRLADAEGLQSVTMRRVAQSLGAGTMTLYRYVASKEDLLDLIFDAAYGELPPVDSASEGW